MIEEFAPYWQENENKQYLVYLEDLVVAKNEKDAENVRNKFEYSIVRNESVTPIAEHFIPIVLGKVLDATSFGRGMLFDFLYSLGAGFSDFDESIHFAEVELEKRCRNQVKYGVAMYFYFLEKGTSFEKKFLPDLLELCSRDDSVLKERVLSLLKIMRSTETDPTILKSYDRNIDALG